MRSDYQTLTAVERASLALRELYERLGYRKYRMGQFEEYSLYMDNKNFLSSERVISFTDLDGRLLALRPDVTLSIVRHASEQPHAAERLYYTESVYRPSAEGHAFKEISQMGIEVLGEIDRYAMTEVTLLAAQSLCAFGPKGLLELSDLRFAVGLFDALGLKDGLRVQALDALGQKNRPALETVARAAGLGTEDAAALCALVELYGPWQPTLERARTLCRGETMAAAIEELASVCAAAAQGDNQLAIDLSLVGHTDYYNGLLLRGYLEGLPRAVLVGGRYDGILKKLGKAGGGIGFALDLSEISRLPEQKDDAALDLLVQYTEDADPAVVARAVAGAARQGLRVRALRQEEDPGERCWKDALLISGAGVQRGGGC